MTYNTAMNFKTLLVLIPLNMLMACDWVDSTGRESNSAPVTQISFADGQSSVASAVNEQSSMRISVSASDADGEISRYQWRPEPIAQGALVECAEFFDLELAVDSLNAACSLETTEDNCTVSFEQLLGDNEGAEFRVNAPQLRAPIGVTYQLDAVDNEGGTGSQQSTFCLIAINEAPDARDDSFTVLEGQVLTVTAESSQHLLTNDEQDDHVLNNDLNVLVQPSRAPSLASSFSLQPDGGFTYAAPLLADRAAESVIDTFVYSVTDGTHISNATVTVNVVARNDPPEQVAPIPLQQVTAGVQFESDLSTFFFDEEGSALNFTISDGTLPASGALTLSPAGILSGTAELIDEGSYSIVIIASDGSQQTTANLDIAVVTNFPVEAVQIPAQVNELGDVLEIDLTEYFSDPEAEPLTYRLNTQSNTASITVDPQTGLLEAVFTTVGRFTVEVSADDGVNIPTTIRFMVTVSRDNLAPVFRGNITNISATMGVRISPINASTRFSDADHDDDELTYTITGILPDGLTLSPTGVLFGTPLEDGIFRAIRVVATDPLGKFARSNAFQIRVLDGE